MSLEAALPHSQRTAYSDLGGTHRARNILDSLTIAQTIAKEIGVTRLADITGLDAIGIPVVVAIRPNAKLLSVAQGKGITLALAKVSALMESIECWYAENIPIPPLKGSYHAVSETCSLLDPTLIGHSIFDLVPLREKTLRWSEGVNLVNNNITYVPYEAISLDSTMISETQLLLGASSNGLASGNTQAEAICHALCELIERDAYFKFCTLSDENRQKRLLASKSITSPIVTSLLKLLDKASIRVQIWDITSDIAFPAFCCLLLDQDIGRKTQIFSGQGCHFDKEIALCRAITEAAQVRLTFISGSRDDVFPSYYEKAIMSEQFIETQGTRQWHTISQPVYHHDFEKNKQLLVNTLATHGLREVVVVEHTPPLSPISVVQIVVPQLHGREE